MGRPKKLDNQNYQELQEEAAKRGIDTSLDAEEMRELIRADMEGDVQTPTPGEMVQEALADEDDEDKPKLNINFVKEKLRIEKTLRAFVQQGLILSFGDPKRDQYFYNTTFNGHMESNHITNNNQAVRTRAAIQMQSTKPVEKDGITYV